MGIDLGFCAPTVFDVDELNKIIDILKQPPEAVKIKLSPMDFDYSNLENQIKEETGKEIKLDWKTNADLSVSFSISKPTKEEVIEWYKRDREIFPPDHDENKKCFHFKEAYWRLPTESGLQNCWIKLTPESIGVLYRMSDKMPDYVPKIADAVPVGVYVTIKKTNSFSFNQI